MESGAEAKESAFGTRASISHNRPPSPPHQTYANLIDVAPGPQLNLVVGPNGECGLFFGGQAWTEKGWSVAPSPSPTHHPSGAGKSSLVCAICIGLGGSPFILGRSRDVGEYVRRGSQRGWVEITLSRGPGLPSTALRRDLTAGSNASEWRLNGSPCRRDDALAVVADLGVQLANLCQFLPQDRVADFARLTPAALLRETEAAAGGAGLGAAHDALVEAADSARAAESAASALAAEEAAAARQHEATRHDAERAEARVAAEARGAAARAKLARQRVERLWRDEEAALTALATAERLLSEARASHDEASRGAAPGTGAAAAAVAATARRVAVTRAALDHEASSSAFEDAVAAAATASDTLRRLPELEAQRESRLAARRAAVERAEAVAADAEAAAATQGDEPASRARKAAADAALSAFTDANAARLTAEAALRAARNDAAVAARRAAAARGADARRAAERSRRCHALGLGLMADRISTARDAGAFRGEVHGPLAAEISVVAPPGAHAAALAAAVEAALPRDLLTRFVVTDAADQEAVASIAAEVGARVAVSLVLDSPSAATLPPPRRAPLASLARFGVTGTLDSCIRAPPAVSRVLADEGLPQFGMVGDGGGAPSDAAAFDVRSAYTAAGGRAAPLRGIIVGRTLLRASYSRYDEAAFTVGTVALREARVLGADADRTADADDAAAAAEAAAAEAAVEAATVAVEAARVAERGAREAMQREQAAAETAATRAQAAKADLAAARQRLAAEERKPGIEAQEAAARQALAAASEAATAAADALVSAAAAHSDAAHAATTAGLTAAEVKAAATAGEAAVAAARADVARRETVAKELRSTARAAAAEVSAAATAAASALTAAGPNAPAVIATLPDDPDELDAIVSEAAALAGGGDRGDAAALARFRERGRALADLRARSASAAADAVAAAARVADARAYWEPRARALVAAVGAEFTRAMRTLGCDGSVTLDPGPPTAPDAAAVRVSVRFREGEALHPLDGRRQSGGERAVATMLYLVALQAGGDAVATAAAAADNNTDRPPRAPVAPFRVVDEINQGMDPHNERAVFGLLAARAAAPGTPQCILLTPKLLPGLPYGEAVTLLQVVNGKLAHGVAAAPVAPGRLLGGV